MSEVSQYGPRLYFGPQSDAERDAMRTDVDMRSNRRPLANIRSEEDARRTFHALGITQWRGALSWDVVDDEGCRCVAEIRHRSRRPRP